MASKETVRLRRENGLCIGCGSKHGACEPGRSRCAYCRIRGNKYKTSDKGRAAKNVYRREWQDAGLCIDCGGKHGELATKHKCRHCADRGRSTSEEKAKRAARVAIVVERWKQAGLCVSCGGKWGERTIRSYCERCRIKRLEIGRRQRAKLKDAVFSSYGGYRCACCGEETKEFLSIDHINNDGWDHREALNGKNIYRWLFRNDFPTGYQVLCMNCNWGKRMNNGICPHQSQRQFAPDYSI